MNGNIMTSANTESTVYRPARRESSARREPVTIAIVYTSAR